MSIDAWTRYGMAPAQVTPEWKKVREALWKEEVSCHHKGQGLPRTWTTHYKKIFMGQQQAVPTGTEFVFVDLQDGSPDLSDIRHAYEGQAWELSPFQDEAKWRWAIVERAPSSLGEQRLLEQGIEQLISYRIGYYAAIWNHGDFTYWGWSDDLFRHFNRYLLGERYHPDGYCFEGYQVKPWISPSILVARWLEGISSWLCGNGASDRCSAVNFTEYWFSLLEYTHPAFFSGKSRVTSGGFPDKTYVAFANHIRYLADLDTWWDESADMGYPVSESGQAARLEYLAELTERVLALPETHAFRTLWLANIDKAKLVGTTDNELLRMPRIKPEDDASFIPLRKQYPDLDLAVAQWDFVPPYMPSAQEDR